MDVEKILAVEQAKLSAHLPAKRIALSEALLSSRPFVPLKSGQRHHFDKKELEFLASLLSPEEYDRLKLPIFITMDRHLGPGTARITGEPEVKILAKILGKQPVSELLIYRPEISVIRSKLPTTTQYLFVPG